jgi:hypothetical protein
MILFLSVRHACGDGFADHRECLVDGIDARGGHIHPDEFKIAIIEPSQMVGPTPTDRQPSGSGVNSTE